MCGRCRCTLDRQQSVSFAERAVKEGVIRVDESFASFEPSYNICPGKHVPILVSSEEGVTLRSAVWGLVPRFQKSRKHDHYKMFNARSEELSAKPSFAGLGRNRCVVLTQGFFEWDTKRVLGRMEKQPYIIYFDGEGGSPAMMAMAGLYDTWKDPETGEKLVTCTILTTSSSSELKWLHDRMPVLLGDDAAVERWLDVDSHKTITREMIQPYESQHGPMQIKFHKVTQKMSKPSFQGEECVKRIQAPKTLAAFFAPPAKKERSGKKTSEQMKSSGAVKNEKEDT